MKSKNSRKIIVHILLLLGITITVFPFVWMILTSFKTVGEAMQIPPTIFPKKFLTDAYSSIVTALPFGRVYLNTIISTVVTTVVQVLYGSLCICKNRIPIQECNLCTGVICTYGTGSDIPDPTVPDCSESWTSGHDTGIVPAKLIQCIWNISSETVLYVIAEGTGRSGVAGRL